MYVCAVTGKNPRLVGCSLQSSAVGMVASISRDKMYRSGGEHVWETISDERRFNADNWTLFSAKQSVLGSASSYGVDRLIFGRQYLWLRAS